MKENLNINNFEIKERSRVFIIAEAGVNHNGELEKALQLVDIAADAGADAVKFQTYRPEGVVTKRGGMAKYQEKNLGQQISQLEMIKVFELNEDHYPAIMRRCQERGIMFLSTPHGGRQSVDLLESLKVTAYKIGSGDLTNYILLDKVAKTGKPVILSSGMATMHEVKDAIRFVKSRGNKKIAMLQCTTNYPCPLSDVNLAAMVTMMRELDVPVGYSDHTEGIQVAIMAATLGAAIYECHFTIDKSLPGPDHVASAEPDELAERIRVIRNISVILGNNEKVPTQGEVDLPIIMPRKSIVVVSDFPVGHVISEKDLEAKRPGDGASPTLYEQFIGKKLKRSVAQDDQLFLKDIE